VLNTPENTEPFRTQSTGPNGDLLVGDAGHAPTVRLFPFTNTLPCFDWECPPRKGGQPRGVFDPSKTLQLNDHSVVAQNESDGSRFAPYMSSRMKTTRVFVSQQTTSLADAMDMALGHDVEWYTDESMIRAIVDDMAANVGLDPPKGSVSSFIEWVRDSPHPEYATDEFRPVMLESFIIVVFATTLASFRNRASWNRQRTSELSLTVDRFGNEVELPSHGPVMLLPSLPPADQDVMSRDEEVRRVSYV